MPQYKLRMSDDDAISLGVYSWDDFFASLPQFDTKSDRQYKAGSSVYMFRFALDASFAHDVVVENVRSKRSHFAFAKVPPELFGDSEGGGRIPEVDQTAIFVTLAPTTGLAMIHYKIAAVQDTYRFLERILRDPIGTHRRLLTQAPILSRTVRKLPTGNRFTTFNPRNYKPIARSVVIQQPTGVDLARYELTFELPVGRSCCSCFRQVCEIRSAGQTTVLAPILGAMTPYCPCPDGG